MVTPPEHVRLPPPEEGRAAWQAGWQAGIRFTARRPPYTRDDPHQQVLNRTWSAGWLDGVISAYLMRAPGAPSGH